MYQSELLFDVSFATEDDFAEIGLIAWNLIGNKITKLYRYTSCIKCPDNTIELPCNVDMIVSVNLCFEEGGPIENIIENSKFDADPLFAKGRYVEYEKVGNTLYFPRNYGKVTVLYKGIILDDNGLPYLTDAESLAIATFAAYTMKYKEALKTNNTGIMNIALNLKKEWYTRCDQARIPESVSQNDMNEILDAKSNWNRKIFNKSYHPFNK